MNSRSNLPPPKGYLKRLREITSKHGILLIFDEVVTGFGRLGAPFAAHAPGVTPDLITCAKGMCNGAVPIGGVLVHRHVHDAMSQGPEATVEFAHGYTYSGHPLACAAALATLDVYQEEGIFEKSRIAGKWEAAIHGVSSAGGVVRDIRNLGLPGAVEIEATSNAPGNGREFKRKESEINEADRYSTAHNGAVAGSSLVAGERNPRPRYCSLAIS